MLIHALTVCCSVSSPHIEPHRLHLLTQTIDWHSFWTALFDPGKWTSKPCVLKPCLHGGWTPTTSSLTTSCPLNTSPWLCNCPHFAHACGAKPGQVCLPIGIHAWCSISQMGDNWALLSPSYLLLYWLLTYYLCLFIIPVHMWYEPKQRLSPFG